MKIQEIEELRACLSDERTLFAYYRDRFAAMLLAWVCDDATTVADIKRSRFSGLLNKASVKELIANQGSGMIDSESLAMSWAEPHEQFLLTLDTWGGESRRWQQTSRNGFNLVLQVNLHEGYLNWFEKVMPHRMRWCFADRGHPTLNKENAKRYRQTLGWIRIDLDLTTGEALLEEIQSDWIRDIRYVRGRYSDLTSRGDQNVRMFCDYTLGRFGKVWEEVLMAAALWFLKEELGLASIWYHTHDSGQRLKRIGGAAPPRSLYTSLPKRFCFEKTEKSPQFLLRDKGFRRSIRRQPDPQWFHLDLSTTI